jgi:DnaJ-class molecular chaperone
MATKCTGCDGKGYVMVQRGTTDGKTVNNPERCGRCNGSGDDPSNR